MQHKILSGAILLVAALGPSALVAQTFTICDGEYETNKGGVRTGCRGAYDTYVYCGETNAKAAQLCKQAGASGASMRSDLILTVATNADMRSRE